MEHSNPRQRHSLQLRLPFVETGFWSAELASNYYQDYKLDEREPLSLQLDVSRTEVYGNSGFANSQCLVKKAVGTEGFYLRSYCAVKPPSTINSEPVE